MAAMVIGSLTSQPDVPEDIPKVMYGAFVDAPIKWTPKPDCPSKSTPPKPQPGPLAKLVVGSIAMAAANKVFLIMTSNPLNFNSGFYTILFIPA